MYIDITTKTKTREILPFLTTNNIREVCKQVDAIPIDPSLPEMTLEEFDELISSPEKYVMKLARKHRRALRFLGACRDMFNQLEGFSKFVKSFEVQQTAEEKQAANGVPFPSFGNSMLTTVIEFYHLHSVEEAAKMKVKEWMLAFEHSASNAMYSRRYSDIARKNAKLKRK